VNFADWLARLDRVQRALAFKVAASVVALVLAVGVVVGYSVTVAAVEGELPMIRLPDPVAAPAAGAAAAPGAAGAEGAGGAEGAAAQPGRTAEQQAAEAAARASAQAVAESINSILQRRLSLGAVAVGAAAGLGVMLAVIWMNLALTYLGLGLVGALVAYPLLRSGNPSVSAWGTVLAGALVLAGAFAALVRVLKAALMASHPVLSIARNVIDEAVRMKVSLVFIILLIGVLALLPTSLDAGAPLRYRVQGFLSYGLGAAYWLTVVLAVFLATSSIAFEQRDKVIWQTMTKPVTAWQYVLGKWLGVWAVAALLLGIASCGVFLFTEYLRNQPAQGEARAFVAADGSPITADRLLLETQVLTARSATFPSLPVLDEQGVKDEVKRRAEARKQSDPTFAGSAADLAKMREEFFAEFQSAFLTIPPGEHATYLFQGLGAAREQNLPLTLRFKVNAGANLPTETYRLTFLVDRMEPFVLECRLGVVHTHTIPPVSVMMPSDLPGEPLVASGGGTLRVQIFNGDLISGRANPETLSFPSADLEVSFATDSFRNNFFRGVGVLWLRVGMLAAVAVMAATFLSFPVASLVSFGFVFAAESVQFLGVALEAFSTVDPTNGDILWHRVPAWWVSNAVYFVLEFYGKVDPVEAMVEGRVVPWYQLTSATFTLGLITAGLLAAGAVIFRRRELAIYSGQ
jgi:hypothetical protein